MNHVRSLLATAALALAPAIAVAAPGAAEAHPAGSTCHSFASGATAGGYTLCVKVLGHLPEAQREIYASFIENDTDADRSGDTCTSTVQHTFRWGGAAKVPGEGKQWLYAQVARATSESFEPSRHVTRSDSTAFTVPARSTRYCSYVERFERYDTVQCVTGGSGEEQCRRRVFRAPAREGWIIGDAPAA